MVNLICALAHHNLWLKFGNFFFEKCSPLLIAIWCRLRSILIRIHSNTQNGTQNWHVSNHRDTFAQFSSMDDFINATVLHCKQKWYVSCWLYILCFLKEMCLNDRYVNNPDHQKDTLTHASLSVLELALSHTVWNVDIKNLGINYWPWSAEPYAVLSFNQTVWLVAYKWAIIPPHHKSLPNHTHI